MNLLVLVGTDDNGVSSALSWLGQQSAGAPIRETATTTHTMVLVAPDQVGQLLDALPDALGTPRPPGWPDHLCQGLHPVRLGTHHCVLCIGPLDQSLSDCVCQAQGVWLGRWADMAQHAHRVSRLCALHANLTFDHPPSPSEQRAWNDAGFAFPDAADRTPPSRTTRYAPRWPANPLPVDEPSEAVVIGAGLAGAAAALCLVREGWRVTLIDRHAGPAMAASGLPVGMLSAHITARETTLSELSRTGMPLHIRELQTHVPEGAGWQATQVTNLKGVDADGDEEAGECKTGPLTLPAALVRPGALVQAWLTEAAASGRLTTLWSSEAIRLEPATTATPPDHWVVTDRDGQPLARAPHVVVTAAYDSAKLLSPWVADMSEAAPLRPVKGQMTLGPLTGTPLASHPMRQHGVYVPEYRDTAHPLSPRLWSMGSTYERGQNTTHTTVEAHARNAASLSAMHPGAHALLSAQAAAGETVEWAQVRCASLDRMPLVGALPSRGPLAPSAQLDQVPRVPGLWTVCALGSRGLTLAMLAAHLLVARMLHKPLPVSRRHAQAMDPARFALKQARKRATTQTGNKPGQPA